MSRWLGPLVLLAILGLSLAAWSAEESSVTSNRPVAPQVPAVKLDCPPGMDGRIDDACGQQATHVSGFWRLEDCAPEYEQTGAWICYDRDCVYVAWYCHDSQTGKIVAQQRKRGGLLLGDDWVGIDLDADFDGRGAYWFDVSTGGTQVENIPGGAAAKAEWRGDWQAATTRIADGW